MKSLVKWQRVQKPLRDFVCALVMFSALFVVMAPSRHQIAPIPILSLFSGSTATAADYGSAAASRNGQTAVHKSFIREPLPAVNMPLISTILALVFSSIVAFNLALLRHLRRVNASSRRGAWKES